MNILTQKAGISICVIAIPLGLEYGKVRDFVNNCSEAFNGNISIEQGTYAGMGCAIISMGDHVRKIMYNGDVYTESRNGSGKHIGLSVSKVADILMLLYTWKNRFCTSYGFAWR